MDGMNHELAGPALQPHRSTTVRAAISAFVAVLALAVSPALAAATSPGATVEKAVPVEGGFSLRGTITPHELDTSYHFEYGTTTSYGTDVPVPDADAGSGGYYYPTVSVSQPVTGLAPNTTYHYRLVALNSDGPGTSGDETFTTPANPSAPPPSPEPQPGENQSGSGDGRKGTSIKVNEARIRGRTVLTTAGGHTLYSLSAEKRDKFICAQSSGCLALWHPLEVPSGGTVRGPVKLGSIKRPEGGVQSPTTVCRSTAS
jgi:hypothetical protein